MFKSKNNFLRAFVLVLTLFSISFVTALPTVYFTNGNLTNINSSQFWRNLATPEDILLNDLGDVYVPLPSDGQVLRYNATSSLWESQTIGGTGTVTSVTRGFGINNSGTSITSTGTIELNLSLLNGLYSSSIWGYNQTTASSGGTFNATYNIWTYNQSLTAINYLNSTYGKWWYNMSDGTSSGGSYNATYDTWAYNQTTPAINYLNSTYNKWWYNQTIPALAYTDVLNSTYIRFWINETIASIAYTDSLNASYNKWWYNMSDGTSSGGTFNATYNLWAYNQTYSGSTFNATYNSFAYNQTYSGSTFNTTYNAYAYNQTTAGQSLYLNLSGTNSNQNINVNNDYNISVNASGRICLNGAICTSYIWFNGTNTIIR